MPTPQARAKRYRDRAEECLRLAEIAQRDDVHEQYVLLATHYEELAAGEEKFAEEQRKWRRSQGLPD
jgi:hypothetical protein